MQCKGGFGSGAAPGLKSNLGDRRSEQQNRHLGGQAPADPFTQRGHHCRFKSLLPSMLRNGAGFAIVAVQSEAGKAAFGQCVSPMPLQSAASPYGGGECPMGKCWLRDGPSICKVCWLKLHCKSRLCRRKAEASIGKQARTEDPTTMHKCRYRAWSLLPAAGEDASGCQAKS